jgi:hypothetical protein
MESKGAANEGGWQIEGEGLSLELRIERGGPVARLVHQPSQQVWVDGPVVYRLETGDEGDTSLTQRLKDLAVEAAGDSLIICGQLGHLAVRHELRLESGSLLEGVELRNAGKGRGAIQRLEIGLTWPLTGPGGELLGEAREAEWVPIPARRHQMDATGGYDHLSASDLLRRRPDLWFGHHAQDPVGRPLGFRGAEGWVADGWCFTKKGHSLVTLKHGEESAEFSVLDAEEREGVWFVRFGGTGLIWPRGRNGREAFPGRVITLGAGEVVRLGLSRHEVVAGDWQAGYEAFRRYFDSQGYRPPKDFDPPVHWNQLYDMTSWHTTRGYEDKRQELYTLEALREEAGKAAEYHCEALYLDPGWDTGFGSAIWDEARLGREREFCEELRERYGLKLSLHCPLAIWNDPAFYPAEAVRMNEQGARIPGRLCSGSNQYLEVKAERLLKLCKEGATFLMYDGAAYTGACSDPDHGHPIPYGPDDHARNYRRLCEVVLKEHPEVLIELHDVYTGGGYNSILPKHFPHRPGGNVENWGNEYMWTTYEDLFTGRMKYLDYVNRAYSIPMYLHISLINDNEHGLALWYAASTCRHLGIGGTHPNPQVAAAHKGHMAKYRKLKRFFAQGEFVGIDEDTHVHVLADRREAVVLLFNFAEQSALRSGEIVLPERFDLGGDLLGHPLNGIGGHGNRVFVNVVVPPRGVRVMVLEQRENAQGTHMTW